MKAIVLNGTDVIIVSNLKRKRKKIEANPQMKILEEFEDEIPEERFSYWKSLYVKQEFWGIEQQRESFWYRSIIHPECFMFIYKGEPMPDLTWRESSSEEFKTYFGIQ